MSLRVYVYASPSAGGSVTGDGTYNDGDTITISATPTTGYQFVKWLDGDGNVVSTSASYSFAYYENPELLTESEEEILTQDGDEILGTNSVTMVLYTAVFELIYYTISTSVTPSGAGTVTGGGSYTYGTSVTLTATASSGLYTFLSWDDGEANTSRTITVTEDASYIAAFIKQKLPSNYVPCSSFVTTGVYFDTGVVSSDGLNCISMIGSLSDTYPVYLFGARDSASESSSGQLGVSVYSSTSARVYYGSSYVDVSDFGQRTETRIENIGNAFDLLNSSYYSYIEATSSTFTGSQNIYLCGLNNAGSAVVTSNSVVFVAFRIEQDGSVIHEWIPVYDEDTSSYCLYDIVDGSTLSPLGGGTFATMHKLTVQGSTGGGAYIEYDQLGQINELYTNHMTSDFVDSTYVYSPYGATINVVEKKGYTFVNWTDENGDVISTDKFTYVRLSSDRTLTANFRKDSEYQNNKYQLLGLEYGMGPTQARTPSSDGRLSNFYTTVKDFSIAEDGLARATSTIMVDSVPSTYQVNMGVILFSPKGEEIYIGIIKNIEDTTLTCREALSIFDGEYVFRPNSTYLPYNALRAVENSVVSPFIMGKPDFYHTANVSALRACECYYLYARGSVARYDRLKNPLFNIPEITDYSVGNAEDYLFEMLENFGILFASRRLITGDVYPQYTVPYKSCISITQLYCNQKPALYIGTNIESISNVSIEEEAQTYTSVDILDSTGVYIRGHYSLDENGTIVSLDSTTLADTYAYNNFCRKIEMSDDSINTIVRQYLTNAKFSHKITFTVDLTQEVYRFDDFEIGRWVKFYDGDKVYDSMITGYSFSYSKDDVKKMTVVLGNVRTTLTDKLNMKKV